MGKATSRSAPEVADSPWPLPLLGRDLVLRALSAAVEEAVSGRGGLVFVTGDPGIGKTALATVAAAWAESRGARVLWGPSWEGDGAPGYWPWVQVLRDYLRDAPPERLASLPDIGLGEVGHLVPELAPLASGSAKGSLSERGRFELFDAAARVLIDAASSEPVVVILDDLQWADAPSVELLAFLSRRLQSSSLLVIGTYRETDLADDREVGPLLTDLAARSLTLPLMGLTTHDVARLMTVVTGEEPPDELAAAVARRTGGNPFFVQEVARILLARDADLRADAATSALPEGVRETIERRLARLSEPCVRLLELVAVAPAAATVPVLSQISGETLPAVTRLLSEAARMRVLGVPQTALGIYRFAHDLFRETIYAGLDPEARGVLHLRVASALEHARAAGSDVRLAELAHHYVLASGCGEESKGLAYSVRAAVDASARFSYDEAAVHYQRALEMLDLGARSDEASRIDLLLGRADALRLAGKPRPARDALEAAIDLARRDDDGAGLAHAALGIHALGAETGFRHAPEIELLNEALAALKEDNRELRARLLASLAQEMVWSEADTDTGLAQRAAEEACDIARAGARPDALAFCLLASHDVVWGPGTEAQRLDLADEMIVLAEEARNSALLMEARLLRCTALLGLGDRRAVPEFERFVRDGIEAPQARIRYLALSRSATVALMRGELAEAERLIVDARSLADEIHEPDGWQVMFAQLLELRTAQGRLFELLDDQMMTRAAAAHSIGRRFLQVARLDQGGAGGGDSMTDFDVAAIPRLSLLPTLALTARLALASQDANLRRRVFDELLPFAGSNVVNVGAVTYMGAVSHYLGMLAHTLDRGDEAKGYLEAALEMHERLGAHPWVARTRYELARALMSDGRSIERARRLLADALSVAERLGMAGLAQAAADVEAEIQIGRSTNAFRKQGPTWIVSYRGKSARLKDAKGLHDIAALVAARGMPVHAADLVAATSSDVAAVVSRLGADDVLDDRARREYRARLDSLEKDIAEAEAENDPERLARAKEERAVLADELAAALGLSGRTRRLGDDSERARKTVTARIRDSISRIAHAHPALGEHLAESITTGTFCSYSPADSADWQL